MVSLNEWEESRERLRRKGESGGMGKNAPRQQTEDDINRRIRRLELSVELLMRHQRQGPDWEKTFLVHSDDVDADNQVTIDHDLGYTPNAFVLVMQANAILSTTKPTNHGGLRFVTASASQATFQFDTEGADIAVRRIFVVIPFRTSFIPPNFDQEQAQVLFGDAGAYESEAPPRGVYTP